MMVYKSLSILHRLCQTLENAIPFCFGYNTLYISFLNIVNNTYYAHGDLT